MNGKVREEFIKLTKNIKWQRIIIAVGILGIALVFLSNYIGADTHGKDDNFSVKTYGTKIESDLEGVICKIQGAGKTRVLLTMENSVEYVYLKDSTTKTKEIQPLIRGVLVVCEGGDEPVVVERVTEAVCKALNISTAKVCVTKLSE
ncbi:MAG TPA: hypothetical protein DEO32_00815 [Ruminococcaceae bacterium]|nr:hypothetical protein [Oscillospiraceae bacterium]